MYNKKSNKERENMGEKAIQSKAKRNDDRVDLANIYYTIIVSRIISRRSTTNLFSFTARFLGGTTNFNPIRERCLHVPSVVLNPYENDGD